MNKLLTFTFTSSKAVQRALKNRTSLIAKLQTIYGNLDIKNVDVYCLPHHFALRNITRQFRFQNAIGPFVEKTAILIYDNKSKFYVLAGVLLEKDSSSNISDLFYPKTPILNSAPLVNKAICTKRQYASKSRNFFDLLTLLEQGKNDFNLNIYVSSRDDDALCLITCGMTLTSSAVEWRRRFLTYVKTSYHGMNSINPRDSNKGLIARVVRAERKLDSWYKISERLATVCTSICLHAIYNTIRELEYDK
jgi:hypothetical protein